MPALSTTTGSYRVIHQTVGTATEATPTDFSIGAPAGSYDLSKSGGGADQTDANGIALTVSATASDNDTATIELWGIADQGCQERIAAVAYIFGPKEVSTGVLWADTATVTPYHITPITTADSANEKVVKVSLDATGYKYLRCYVTARSGAEDITVRARGW